MTSFLGIALYHHIGFRDRPSVAREAIELVGRTGLESHACSFYGMLSGSDVYARPRRAREDALSQLEIDVRAGVFSDLVAYTGKKGNPDASLTLQVAPTAADIQSSLLAALIVRCVGADDLAAGEQLGIDLWGALQPDYGFAMLGGSFADAAAELNCIPIRQWGSSSGASEERLLRLQALRREFGRQTRGPAWGTYLGHDLIARLGGPARVRTSAPVFEVRDLPFDGMYLRLSAAPQAMTVDLDVPVERLRRFLAAVTPTQLLTR
jgi:hypothetical protein